MSQVLVFSVVKQTTQRIAFVFRDSLRSFIMKTRVNRNFGDILTENNKTRIQSKNLQSDPSIGFISREHRKKQAAVLVPLCEINGIPSILFTLRSNKLTKHRGEVSFPGGGYDESDGDLLCTALRETQEELGVSPSSVDVWTRLSPFAQTTRYGKTLITPFIGNFGCVSASVFKINSNEVMYTFCEPIEHLCNPSNIRTTHYRGDRSHYNMPVYLCTHKVWGLTASVLHLVLSVIAPQHYVFTFDILPSVYQEKI